MMLKLLSPALVGGLCAIAGGAAGLYLKTGSVAPTGSGNAPDPGMESAETKAGAAKSKKQEAGHEKSGKKAAAGGSHEDSSESPSAYYKFSREFVVPIIDDERVKSLVILNLNLEIEPGMSDELFSKEPVLRDSIMTTLIKLSSRDDIFNGLNDVENYEAMRSMILEGLRDTVSGGIKNVLILDMARQDL